MQRYILYQAYGNEGILLECKFSLMQLLKHNAPDSFCIVLYTDNHDFFKPLLQHFPHHEIVALLPERIKEWRGVNDFIHRVKIKMLLDFFATHKGSVLYFDTDTYCIKPIKPLFEAIAGGAVLMHTCEGRLGSNKNLIFKKWSRFLNSNPVSYKSCRINDIDAIEMWNAGVLGFADDAVAILQDVLALTDTIYPLFPKHTVEQFAFSFIFQQTRRLQPADEYIYHFWDLKEYRALLQYFFEMHSSLSTEQQINLLQEALPEKLFAEKSRIKKMPFFKRWLSAEWNINAYKKRLG